MSLLRGALPNDYIDLIAVSVCGRELEEIRLRIGRRPQLVFSDGEILLDVREFTKNDADETLSKLCRRSVYAHDEEIRRGFISCEGGVRVGVCGRGIEEKGRLVRFSDISCFNIRIPREAVGCAEKTIPFFIERGRPVSCLIAAPPGGGKTTLLRDVARCLSDGVCTRPFKVALADERGELAGSAAGRPGYSVGSRTDVIDHTPKAEAVGIFIRTMSPEVIITDEIGGSEDAEALAEAARCGAAVIASIHAYDGDDLLARLNASGQNAAAVFKRFLFIRRNGSALSILPLKL